MDASSGKRGEPLISLLWLHQWAERVCGNSPGATTHRCCAVLNDFKWYRGHAGGVDQLGLAHQCFLVLSKHLHKEEEVWTQYNTIRAMVDDLVFAGLSEEQLRQSPNQDQNSLAWLLWHASRWEDFLLSLLDTNHRQVLDQEDWPGRLNLSRRDGALA